MSPIFYVNAKPHIGHLYTALYCDAVHMFNKLQTGDSFFSIGTDEHGLKIQKKAQSLGYDSPQAMCDENAEHFAELFRQAKVVPSTFIRTTDSRHRVSVQAMWNKLQRAGHIVKGSHSGYYSTNEETFFPEKDLVKAEDGSMRVPGSGEVCDFVTEDNYVFKFNDSMKS